MWHIIIFSWVLVLMQVGLYVSDPSGFIMAMMVWTFLCACLITFLLSMK